MQSEVVTQAKAAALADFGGQGAAHKNCAQAVMLFALRALGEDPAVAEYARYFGGGIGRTGSTCGVITGATMALGVRDLHDPDTWADRAPEGVQQLQTIIADFAARFGNTTCRELTGCDIATPEGYAAFKARDTAEHRCAGFIDWMCDRVAEVL
jgi:C_GCAxxG_C_C family probable redox protein